MKQHFLARTRAALDEIEQNAPADLARFEYVDLFAAQVADLAAPRDLFEAAAEGDLHTALDRSTPRRKEKAVPR